jgi:hypothetical protein
MAAPSGGGGGGPGPTGFAGGVASTGSGIQYVGNHAYGNAGTINATSAADIIPFDFTSASTSYIVARMFVGYDADDLASGNQFGYRIKFNDESIFFTRREANAADQVTNPFPAWVDFIIPSETRVTVEGFTNGSGLDMSFIITGRVYA